MDLVIAVAKPLITRGGDVPELNLKGHAFPGSAKNTRALYIPKRVTAMNLGGLVIDERATNAEHHIHTFVERC